MSELWCDLCMLLLILLLWLPLVLVQLRHSITAQVLQLLSIVANLLRLLFNFVHEFSPGLKYLTSYTSRARQKTWWKIKFSFWHGNEKKKEKNSSALEAFKIFNAFLGAIIVIFKVDDSFCSQLSKLHGVLIGFNCLNKDKFAENWHAKINKSWQF